MSNNIEGKVVVQSGREQWVGRGDRSASLCTGRDRGARCTAHRSHSVIGRRVD